MAFINNPNASKPQQEEEEQKLSTGAAQVAGGAAPVAGAPAPTPQAPQGSGSTIGGMSAFLKANAAGGQKVAENALASVGADNLQRDAVQVATVAADKGSQAGQEKLTDFLKKQGEAVGKLQGIKAGNITANKFDNILANNSAPYVGQRAEAALQTAESARANAEGAVKGAQGREAQKVQQDKARAEHDALNERMAYKAASAKTQANIDAYNAKKAAENQTNRAAREAEVQNQMANADAVYRRNEERKRRINDIRNEEARKINMQKGAGAWSTGRVRSVEEIQKADPSLQFEGF